MQGSLCIDCSNGFFLNKATNKCKQVDPLCKTHDKDTGACKSCYLGYSLSGTACILGSQVQIANCYTTTPDGRCSECI